MTSPVVQGAEERCLAAAALESIEALLQEQNPVQSYEPIAEAVRCVIQLRDHLIVEERRGAAVAACLAQVNSLLSLAAGAEYPLVGVRWERFCMVRDALRRLLSDPGPEAEAQASQRLRR